MDAIVSPLEVTHGESEASIDPRPGCPDFAPPPGVLAGRDGGMSPERPEPGGVLPCQRSPRLSHPGSARLSH
jgi:hypothetical protein